LLLWWPTPWQREQVGGLHFFGTLAAGSKAFWLFLCWQRFMSPELGKTWQCDCWGARQRVKLKTLADQLRKISFVHR
jgi:hypothetical protein